MVSTYASSYRVGLVVVNHRIDSAVSKVLVVLGRKSIARGAQKQEVVCAWPGQSHEQRSAAVVWERQKAYHAERFRPE